ncbi:MAG: hypothetical protein WBA74_26365, partial [Cyclobacteriaceae bacterium]
MKKSLLIIIITISISFEVTSQDRFRVIVLTDLRTEEEITDYVQKDLFNKIGIDRAFTDNENNYGLRFKNKVNEVNSLGSSYADEFIFLYILDFKEYNQTFCTEDLLTNHPNKIIFHEIFNNPDNLATPSLGNLNNSDEVRAFFSRVMSVNKTRFITVDNTLETNNTDTLQIYNLFNEIGSIVTSSLYDIDELLDASNIDHEKNAISCDEVLDHDGDGVPTSEEDLNGDRNPENDDTDKDGTPNYLDNDDDNDGVPTKSEDLNGNGHPKDDDTDNDGIPNYLDIDDDGDGINTLNEDDNGDGDPTNDDSDRDNIPNYLDNDNSRSIPKCTIANTLKLKAAKYVKKYISEYEDKINKQYELGVNGQSYDLSKLDLLFLYSAMDTIYIKNYNKPKSLYSAWDYFREQNRLVNINNTKKWYEDVEVKIPGDKIDIKFNGENFATPLTNNNSATDHWYQ